MPAKRVDVIESGIGIEVHPKLEKPLGCCEVNVFVRREGHQ